MKNQITSYTHKDATVHIIYTSSFQISPEYIFYDVDTQLYHDAVAPYLGDSDKIDIPVYVMFIEKGQKKILIDTGKRSDQDGESTLITNLKSLGVTAGDITDIIITHGHNDHIGGLLTNGEVSDRGEKQELYFPNARIHLSRAEYDLWEDLTLNQRQKLGYIMDSTTLFEFFHDSLVPFDGKKEIVPGINASPSGGHTSGHIFVDITLDGAHYFHMGDLFVQPLHVAHPDWHVKPEMHPGIVLQNRQTVTTLSLHNPDVILFANHFPFPGLGKITKDGDSPVWQSLT